LRCPQETANKAGHRGTYKAPPPIDPALWPEIMRRDVEARTKAYEDARRAYEPEVVPPPRVPARAPTCAAEFATSNRGMSAAKLGRHAVAAGWLAEPWYWQEHDGKEGCAVKLARGPLRAVALWSRPAAKAGGAAGWATEYAYAWRTDFPDRFPVKITITDLERFLDDDPDT
jgi:hypothetical protein